MKILLSISCVTVALITLSACSKPATTANGSSAGATATAGAPAVGSDPLVALGSGPGLKVGEWQTTMHMPGMTSGMVTKMCLDEGLSKKFQDMGSSNPGKLDCTVVSATRAGNVIDVASTCKSSGMTQNTKMHMELTGDDSYHQTVESSFDPPMGDPTKVTMDGKYLGACPAGMKPGDLDMGDGMKINMYDVAAKAKKG